TATPEKSRSTVPLTLPCAPPIPSSRSLRSSLGLTSSCDTPISTIFRQRVSISSEDRAAAGSWQSAARADCVLRAAPPRLAYPVSMNPGASELPLVAVVGPTASGKSALGVWLAEQFGGEVLACDSTQLYRGFDIGPANRGQSERRGIPDHLIDSLTPSEAGTAGGYRQIALVVLEDLRSRGRLPILTVGTGLYLRALLEGLADVAERSGELRGRLRASAERFAPGYLHRLLTR